MTVEEKNRAIAEFLGWEWNERGFYKVTNMSSFYRVSPNYCPDEMEFHKSFDFIIPVWSKLKEELYDMSFIHPKKNMFINDIMEQFHTPNIEQAHSLIHEAIQFLNSKK